jgi:perosamine synthetase
MRLRVSEAVVGEAEVAAVVDVLRRGWITQGPMVAEFEAGLAELLGVPPARVVACSSGTAALHLALRAGGIGPGDEVLVPDLTYVATANAVSYLGAKPVLVDLDRTTWGLSLEDAEKKRTRKTKAVVPVHLYGVPVELALWRNFAEAHRLWLVEDAAEALGASYRGLRCGTIGNASAFSFYGNKLVTTGEGGAVVTRDEKTAQRARFYRGQAQAERYFHPEVGFNYRLTDLQAAVGTAQLASFRGFVAARRALLEEYGRALPRRVLTPMFGFHPDRTVSPWLATIELDSQEERLVVERHLEEHEVETRPTFVPLHRLPMYAGRDSDFPVATWVGTRGLSLPTHPKMSPSDARYVAELVGQALRRAVA